MSAMNAAILGFIVGSVIVGPIWFVLGAEAGSRWYQTRLRSKRRHLWVVKDDKEKTE